jgi:hypothetical protein
MTTDRGECLTSDQQPGYRLRRALTPPKITPDDRPPADEIERMRRALRPRRRIIVRSR